MAKTNIPKTAIPEVPTIEVVNAETLMSALLMAVALDLRMTNPSMRGVDSSDGEGIAERAAMNTEESGLDEFYCDQFIDAMRAEKLFNPVGADDVNLSVQAFQADDEDESVSDAVEDPQTVVDSYDIGVQSDSDIEDESYQFQQDDDAMAFAAVVLYMLRMTDTILYGPDLGDLQLDGSSDLYDGDYRPTRSSEAYARSPLGLFFYFLPKQLWFRIADETETYRMECISTEAEKQRAKQLDAQVKDPNKTVLPLEVLESKLEKTKPIQAHEILRVVGLLIARSLCSHMDGLEKHWQTDEDGAIPRGTFNRFITRDRFKTITRYLHFESNSVGESTEDKAWKVRPVLQALEKTFRRGYRLGPRISFDEGTIPNRSKFNPIRVYNKDYPHKYGTKVYMTCCADSGYCSRIEVYLGASDESKKAQTAAQRKEAKKRAK
ncbi:hypothetical protein PR003_g27457 [Phytophthora rubi]|uniref:PiggyBac transposable element-derived protein domain-containing protein n=1 Tax=Phytophthora rubi TaxID=129364 RepID=A0A6A4C3C2_9STRA|nr:hypothetical protein PR003_g27457 [Phytophthora rubi]